MEPEKVKCTMRQIAAISGVVDAAEPKQAPPVLQLANAVVAVVAGSRKLPARRGLCLRRP